MIERIRRFHLGRRDFVKMVLGGFIGATLARLTPSRSQTPTEATEIEENKLSGLNAILALPLNTDERLVAEVNYAGKTKALEDIDRGLWVLSRKEPRAALMEKRAQLRLIGHPNLTPLSSQQIEWAKSKRIHPEVLGVCIDAYPLAKDVVAKLTPVLRPDLKEDISPDQLMINPGGMAMLICTETGFKLDPFKEGDSYRGFVSIGARPAVEEINTEPNAFPQGIEALTELCAILSRNTGLNFNPTNIPGSIRGNPDMNLSGGAIGLQFMPGKALELYEIIGKTGEKFNPFDLTSSLVGAWVYLARQQVFPGGVIRYGYQRNNPEAIKKAIEKWNPYRSQIEIILETAYDYYDRFLTN